MYGNLIPKRVIIQKMNRTQMVSAVALSATYNSPGSGEIVNANSNDVLDKAQADNLVKPWSVC
jgi:hypothetical protein